MSSTQDFTCVFCSEMFEDKESLQEHFRKHGDPKFNNIPKYKSRVQNEPTVGNEKTEEVEMVECDVCDETFKSISKAITHKHKVHPDHDGKYFCPWCGKLFTMKHLYNKHMQSSHIDTPVSEESGYHCDSCSVGFFVPSAMVYHNRFFHRQDTELPAIGNSKKVKTFNQEMVQIYYCPFCGEEYNNKVNLHKHMADDHSDENQSPSEVLRCPLCDAVFYHLDAYELHLSFHSVDDVYSDDRETSTTEFSLESVPPVMEKVEEEVVSAETEGIDKFLQLIMDESRESGNNDGVGKMKSKKHKKHKKSKKSAITLDEFLNMNKDVFGDGLDVQGIEEVPTQQVLKKHKGKRDNIAKAIPASAIAKLKKQGITVKSNSSINTPFKAKTNLPNHKTGIPNRIPMKVSEKAKLVTSSNDLLSKLLIQGNNQIKIVKKSTVENSNVEKITPQTDFQEPETYNKSVKDKNQTQAIETEVANENKNDEMEQDTPDVESKDAVMADDSINNGETSNETNVENNSTLTPKEQISVTKDTESASTLKNDINDINNEPMNSESQETLENTTQSDSDVHMNDKELSFETTGDDVETNSSDDESNLNIAKNTHTSNIADESDSNRKKSNNTALDALKHLSGIITIKPAHDVVNKKDITEVVQGNTRKETEKIVNKEVGKNTILKVATNVSKNIQNSSLKKPCSPHKRSDLPTKSIDALKILNKQLTITPCVSSTTNSNDGSEDDEPKHQNMHDNINTPIKQKITEKDNDNFKTPLAIPKQMNTTAILKRLTNVTAKPVARAAHLAQVNNHLADPRNSVIQKVDTTKQMDQDIEIFNIDDSDSDQELNSEESEHEQLVNASKCNDTKTATSVNVLKNLSKNITVKPTNRCNKISANSKTEVPVDKANLIAEGDVKTSISTERKIFTQNKNLNTNLNHTLKKIGNNISIKSQHSSPDSNRYQMLPDDDIDEHFDEYDEESDSENTNKVKITELHEDDENVPSDIEMEQNKNVIVRSPHASYSDNEDETDHFYSDEERNDDIETQIKTSTLEKETSTSKCLDNFKRNNKELTIKTLNDKNNVLPQTGSPRRKQDEATRVTNNYSKDVSTKQLRPTEQHDEHEGLTKTVNDSASTSCSSQKVTNQVNTVKTVKTFQSETIIEEVTTTITKTIRTVNQSSKQVAQNTNANTYRPRMIVSNQRSKPFEGMTVKNAQPIGTKIRNAAPSQRPTIVGPMKASGQLVHVRSQNQMVPRLQGIHRLSMPGPSNIRKIAPQQTVQKPLPGRPLKISPLALNQTVKRAPETPTGNFNAFKRPKDSMISAMDASDDNYDDSMVNCSSTSSSRSDFMTTATKLVKGKTVMTASQARSEQHSEQQITKLSNMAGLKVVRNSVKQASQVETKNDMTSAKRSTMDAIEKLQKQGLLIKKPRVETPVEDEYFNSDNEDGFEEDYEDNHE